MIFQNFYKKTLIGKQRLCQSCNQKSCHFVICTNVLFVICEFGACFAKITMHILDQTLFDSAPKMLIKYINESILNFCKIYSTICWSTISTVKCEKQRQN